MHRPIKIACVDMRDQGVRGLWSTASIIDAAIPLRSAAMLWPEYLRLSDIGQQFICSACGKRGADVRPDFNWNKQPVGIVGYR